MWAIRKVVDTGRAQGLRKQEEDGPPRLLEQPRWTPHAPCGQWFCHSWQWFNGEAITPVVSHPRGVKPSMDLGNWRNCEFQMPQPWSWEYCLRESGLPTTRDLMGLCCPINVEIGTLLHWGHSPPMQVPDPATMSGAGAGLSEGATPELDWKCLD
jgi:hypothetical protein